MSRYHRFAHLQKTPSVKVGDWVTRGQLIGYCGSTGASSGPHLHYDVPLLNLAKIKGSWRSYVYGMSMTAVRSLYQDPKSFVSTKFPMKAEMPLVGFSYLERVNDRKAGTYYHSGEDLNGLNDLGKPVYSTVDGRVIHMEGTSFIKGLLGKLTPQNWNGGWGNFLVIEEKPGYVVPKE